MRPVSHCNFYFLSIYVVFNFLFQVIFVFLLFWGTETYMLMKLKQKKNKNYLR